MSVQQDLPPHATDIASVTISLANTQRPFYFFNTPLGQIVFKEIFSGKSYSIPELNCEVRTIVDMGANIGASALYFAMLYPQSRIVAFEPSPYSFALLQKNIDGLPNVSAHNVGLFDSDRETSLYIGSQDSVTNSIGPSSLNSDQSVTVQLRNVATVFTELQVDDIDILKIDTEGCELAIMQSIKDLIPRIAVLFVEYHSYSDKQKIERLMADTHILYSGHINSPHRGEFCYVALDRLPENAAYKDLEIRV